MTELEALQHIAMQMDALVSLNFIIIVASGVILSTLLFYNMLKKFI